MVAAARMGQSPPNGLVMTRQASQGSHGGDTDNRPSWSVAKHPVKGFSGMSGDESPLPNTGRPIV